MFPDIDRDSRSKMLVAIADVSPDLALFPTHVSRVGTVALLMDSLNSLTQINPYLVSIVPFISKQILGTDGLLKYLSKSGIRIRSGNTKTMLEGGLRPRPWKDFVTPKNKHLVRLINY